MISLKYLKRDSCIDFDKDTIEKVRRNLEEKTKFFREYQLIKQRAYAESKEIVLD